MRYLIFSESAEAKELLGQLREDGHKASLRNPDYFDPQNFNLEAGVVFTDNEVIKQAFESKGVTVKALSVKTVSVAAYVRQEAVEAAEPETETPVETKPKLTAKKSARQRK